MQITGRCQTFTQAPESPPPDQFLGIGHALGHPMGPPLLRALGRGQNWVQHPASSAGAQGRRYSVVGC